MDTTSGTPEVTQQPPVAVKMERVWFHQAGRKQPVSVPVPEGGTMIMQDAVKLALVQLGLKISVADVTVKFSGNKLAPDAPISQYHTSETKPLWLEVTEPEAGPSSSKRRKLTVSDSKRMFYNALKIATIQDDVLQLPNGVTFLDEPLPSKLYVREAYKDLHSLIHDAYPQDNILVVGNPGTGKSFFALYEMYRLLDKAPIVYESVPFDLFMVLSADNITYAGNRLSKYDPEVEELLAEPETYYLFDAGTESNVFPYLVNAKTIVFSAPNRANYADYSKHASPKILYMPVWTLEELNQVLTDSDEELQTRYNIWGGIPRDILYSNQSTEAIERAIERMSLDLLLELVQKLYEFDNLSHKILHIHVWRDEEGKPDYEREDICFASDRVKDKVFLLLGCNNSVPPIFRM